MGSRLCTHATSWQHNHRASRLKPRLNVEFLKLGQKLEAFYSPSASTDALPTISCRVTEAKSASYLTVEYVLALPGAFSTACSQTWTDERKPEMVYDFANSWKLRCSLNINFQHPTSQKPYF